MFAVITSLMLAVAAPGPDLGAALRELHQGDPARAAELFRELRHGSADPSLSLLEAIARYNAGQGEASRPLFERARVDPELRASAELYLGLLDASNGDSSAATRRFEVVERTGDPELREAAAQLRRTSAREGRLSLRARLQSGYDSNVALMPDQTRQPGGVADGHLLLEVAPVLRPFGPSGPFARALLFGRKQLTHPEFDQGIAGAGLGYRFRGRTLTAELGYDYAFSSLGTGPFSSTHAGHAELDWRPAMFGLRADYALEGETYLTQETAGYSGIRHGVRAGPQLSAGDWLFTARYGAGVDTAQEPSLGYFEHGPSLEAIWVGQSDRLFCDASFLQRTYGSGRVDPRVVFSARYAHELGLEWTAEAGLDAQLNRSSDPDASWDDLVLSVGIAYSLGR